MRRNLQLPQVELYLVSLKRRILQEGAASFGIPLFFHHDSSSHLSSDRVHDVLQFLSNLARCWHRQVRTEGFLYEGTMFFVEKEKKRSLLRWCESKSILPGLLTAYATPLCMEMIRMILDAPPPPAAAIDNQQQQHHYRQQCFLFLAEPRKD